MKSRTGATARRTTVTAIVAMAVIATPAALAASAQAAGPVTSVVSLTAPTAATYAGTIRLTGIVGRYGTTIRVPGVAVWLQRSPHGKNSWSNTKSATTAANGSFSFAVVQGVPYDYRAFFYGSATYAAAKSAVRYPAVRRQVRFDSIRTTDHSRGLMLAAARVLPAVPRGGVVQLQRWDPSARLWRNFASTRSTGSASVSITRQAPASIGAYRIFSPLHYPYAAGVSGQRSLAHHVWRSAFRNPLLARGGTRGGVFTVVRQPALSGFYATAEAVAGGSAWGDVNAAGCSRIFARADNYSDEVSALQLLNGTRPLASVVTPGASDAGPGKSAMLNVAVGGLTTVRVKLVDNTGGGQQDLDVETGVGVLCWN